VWGNSSEDEDDECQELLLRALQRDGGWEYCLLPSTHYRLPVQTGASIIGSLTLFLSVLALGVIVLADSHKFVPTMPVQYRVLGSVIVSVCALSGLGVMLAGATRNQRLYLPFLALQVGPAQPISSTESIPASSFRRVRPCSGACPFSTE